MGEWGTGEAIVSKEQVAKDIRQANWVRLLYGVAVIFGCAYVVFWRGFSGWWFVLAILLAGSFRARVRDDDTGEYVYDSHSKDVNRKPTGSEK
jgi:hypothetical protein